MFSLGHRQNGSSEAPNGLLCTRLKAMTAENWSAVRNGLLMGPEKPVTKKGGTEVLLLRPAIFDLG